MGYTNVILRTISVAVLFIYSLYAIHYAANIFECRRKKKVIFVILSILNTAFIFIGNYLHNPIYVTYFLGIIMLTIQFYFFLKRNIREVLFGASVFIVHLICIQMFVMSVMSIVLDRQPYDMINNYNLFSLNILFSFLFAIFALKFFEKMISNEKIQFIVHNKQQSIMVSLICIYIVLYSCLDSYAYASVGNYRYLAVTMIAIQIVSITSFYLLIIHSLKIGQMSHYKNKHDTLKEELQETIKKEIELKELAYKDHLTGCYTKTYCSNYLDSLIARKTYNYCIVYIDLDRLKLVNDTYGHSEGDYYIKKVATTIINTFRADDVLARIGGDEFLIIVSNCQESLVLKKMKLVQQQLETISNDRLLYAMEISFGILYIDQQKTKATQIELLNEVDYKMYLNKKSKYGSK